MSEIPAALLDILHREHPRELLLLLAHSPSGIRYSEARKILDLKPTQFQRALNMLTEFSLVQLKVRKLHDATLGAADRHVTIKLSPIGDGVAEWWRYASEGFEQTFTRYGLLGNVEALFCEDEDEAPEEA